MGGQRRDGVIDLIHRREAAKTDAHRGIGTRLLKPDRTQYIRRLHRRR